MQQEESVRALSSLFKPYYITLIQCRQVFFIDNNREKEYNNFGTKARKGGFFVGLPDLKEGLRNPTWKEAMRMTIFEAFSLMFQAGILLFNLLIYIEKKNTKK